MDDLLKGQMMAEQRRVAMMLELEWPYRRHHEVFAGTHRYGQEQGGWKLIPDEYPEVTLESKRSEATYDGIIGRVTPRLAAAARAAGVPLVNVWHNSPVTDVPLVAPDFEAAGRMAADHLLARGFAHFGFLGRKRERSARERLAGFREVLTAAGFSCSVLMVTATYVNNPDNWRKFTVQLDEWMDGWSGPVGVSTSYDLLARHVACACDRRGLNVPQDVALVGAHNESVICLQPEPSLTSIDLGYERIGYQAAELLDRLMDGQSPPTKPQSISPAELIPRQSTDSYAVDDPLVARALRFIAEHGHEAIKVSDVVAAMPASRRAMERRFQNAMRRSIADEITRLRLERAKRRLVESNESLKSVAGASGFSNPTHFYRAFIRVEGLSPTEYRHRHQKGH